MGWKKMKLGEVLENREGRYKPNDPIIAGLKRIDKINFSGQIFLSDKSSNTDMILVKKGDLVISGINVEKGALAVYEDAEDIVATIHYSSYKFNSNKIDIDFLKVFLRSPDFVQLLKEQVPGGIKTEIKPKHILPLVVNFPETIKEQKKIAAQFFDKESKFQKIDKNITYQLTLIEQLNQAILQEAVQGKLVPQNADDEPAAELLKRIKSEKATLRQAQGKKEKPLPPIKPEEIPFEIPNSWVWCRLGEICEKIGSGSTPKGSNYSQNGFPFFRSQNIYNDGLIYDDITFISPEVQNQMSGTVVFANDILLNITGGSMGRCALVPSNFEQGNVSQHVCIIRPISVDRKFYHNVILSPFIQKLIFSSTTGAGREGLPKYNLEQFPIPLPPLAEQKRIVAEIEKQLAKTKQLKEYVLANQKATEQLLKALLHQAFEVKEETGAKPYPVAEQDTVRIAAEPEAKIIKLPKEKKDRGPIKQAMVIALALNKHLQKRRKLFRTKGEKTVHLVETVTNEDFGRNPIKGQAGPVDFDYLIKIVEPLATQNKWFTVNDEQKPLKNGDIITTHEYIPGENFADFVQQAQKELASILPEAVRIIDLFVDLKSFHEAEIISTTYAGWNNLIIRGEKITTKSIVLASRDQWHEKKKEINKDEFEDAINWLKANNLVPTGKGKEVKKELLSNS